MLDCAHFIFIIQRDQLQRYLNQNSNGFKNFDLRYKDLRETLINSMSFKSLVINTQKKGIKKITKK